LEEGIEQKRVFWKEGKKEESKNKRVRKEEWVLARVVMRKDVKSERLNLDCFVEETIKKKSRKVLVGERKVSRMLIEKWKTKENFGLNGGESSKVWRKKEKINRNAREKVKRDYVLTNIDEI
jgi:hypothetical protein